MAEDLMKPDGKSTGDAAPQLPLILKEELNRYFDQLNAMILELEHKQKNEDGDERAA